MGGRPLLAMIVEQAGSRLVNTCDVNRANLESVRPELAMLIEQEGVRPILAMSSSKFGGKSAGTCDVNQASGRSAAGTCDVNRASGL